ncbi:MAG: dTMP kinase [Methanobrevibacter sp.]|uniref:dTMP kinase n=1 Tax=Methanobrevibacter sp. TaxID=66852 RepID=UPI001B02876A|nr:dTMP kinase [Methanobrevibacter sp.]MBO7241921.1 dTMP kinase [Methanobrevibacter sp.]MBQ6139186.1 dTMP kinase [Methanobrevibacter sp.]
MYIVLEGIDGAGKSTQIKMLKEWLESNGLRVETIVEPTDMEVGKLIRKLLTRSDATSDTMQKTLGLLFAADRLILMDKIEQLEKDNVVVISDRSFYSSLSYQDPQDWIKEINKFAKIPDLVLLLDLDVKKSVERCDGTDEFENEEFLTGVKQNYLDLAGSNDNFKIIDANNGPNKVSSDIKKAVAPLFDICKDCIL